MSDCCGFGGGFGGAGGATPAGGVNVEDDGTPIGGDTFGTLNFIGPGVVAVDGGSAIAEITIPGNVYSPPEAWVRNNVPANQVADTPLSALVSQSFNTIKMIRAGSIVGLATRLSEPITAGQLVVFVTKNGVSVLQIVHNAGSNPSGGVATQAVGVETYVAGDLVGVSFTTNAGFLPTTTDLEAWVQLFEAP